METADTGGAALSVDPTALAAASSLLRGAATSGREALGTAMGTVCIATGSPELDAALGRFDGRLQVVMEEATSAADGLGDAVAAAAIAYRDVDTSVMPVRGPR